MTIDKRAIHREYLVIFLAVTLFACEVDGEETPESPVHWSYDGYDGPAAWGSLSDDYSACELGAAQSPIDLVAAAEVVGRDIRFGYQTSGLTLLNNGHTIQATYDEGSYLELDGQRYELLQFHVHAASEHTVNDQSFPLELHLVHQSAAGDLAVVGLFVVEGEANRPLAGMWRHLPAEETEPKSLSWLRVNAADFIPEDHTLFSYTGSLTTPPCTEGVSWNVFTTPIEMSPGQIDSFTEIFDHNRRPVQPLNDRDVEEIVASD